MEINVLELYNEITNLSFLLEEHEKNTINLYRNYSYALDNWKDEKSFKFLSNLEREKAKEENVYNQIKDLKEIYKYIYNSYSKIGNKIYFNEDKKESLVDCLNECLDEIDNIINAYNSVNLELYSREYVILENELIKVNELKVQMKELVDSINNVLNNIINVEDTVNDRLSKIKFEIIQESDINEYL